jgi:hypothetical protein
VDLAVSEAQAVSKFHYPLAIFRGRFEMKLSACLLCSLVTGGLAAANFIPASNPAVTYQGRTQINVDGSRSFDWEAVQMQVNLNGRPSFLGCVCLQFIPI